MRILYNHGSDHLKEVATSVLCYYSKPGALRKVKKINNSISGITGVICWLQRYHWVIADRVAHIKSTYFFTFQTYKDVKP